MPAPARSVHRVFCSSCLVGFDLLYYLLFLNRIRNTKRKRVAQAVVSPRNGLVMAIAMIKITCADATGMAGIVVARKTTFSTAHTVSVETQITRSRSSINLNDDSVFPSY